MKYIFLLVLTLAVFPCVLTGADNGTFVITKSVSDNPSLSFSGLPSHPELDRELRSILGACGWFDIVPAKGQYELKASAASGAIRLELTLGGAPAGTWRLPASGNARRLAKKTVDAIIEKTFSALKIRSFCNSQIAFCAETRPGIRNVFLCDIDGGDVRQLTAYRSLCVEPAWFPNGKSVVYTKYNAGGMDVLETRLAPLATRRLIGLKGINAGAAISPDGRYLAAILSPDHKVDLYTIELATGRRTRLTSGIAVEASPCWSPDGQKLVYVSDETGNPRLFICDRRGRNRTRLPSIGRDAVTPDWSYNGKIVYAAKVDGQYTVAVYDPATGENKRVVNKGGNWESPAWAADGRQVVCKRTTNGNSALYVIDTWTGRIRRLLSTPYNLYTPAWSPCAIDREK